MRPDALLNKDPKNFLPVNAHDLQVRGWDSLDIILVTGDAYVDHPSYGVSVIGRVLEDAGFKVGIIAQPDWHSADDFMKLGRPKLFFGVTAGNLDSMVSNYTASRKPRRKDEYSPGGQGGLRPDRAVVVYANRIREAFKNVPIVIGGMEASMRRLGHYDWWSNTLRRSVLSDSKADILVYGMGERQALEIACRLKNGEDIKKLSDINGTVIIRNDLAGIDNYIEMPSFEDLLTEKTKFSLSHKIIYQQCDPLKGKTLVQKHGERFVIQFPPAMPFETNELDHIYELPYARSWHPIYDKPGGVPGFETVRFSVISHRGCCGACSFCSLYLHQGRIVQSRSRGSILREIEQIAGMKGFKGTITDIGGPTANLYKASCKFWSSRGPCDAKRCLVPGKCENLALGYDETMALWKDALKIKGVKHIFIGSGVRYDLLTDPWSDQYLKELAASHISGRLKVAPEHCSNRVLDLMGKPNFKKYTSFVARFHDMNKKLGKEQYLVNYFISAHPGSTLEDTLELALHLIKWGIHPEQIQDFIPLPLTISGAMYYSERDPFTGKRVYVAKGDRERKLHHALIQYKNPENRRYILEALEKLDRLDLKGLFFGQKNAKR